MTDREKIDAAVEYLRALGLRPSTATPPIYRLLWRLGILIPPPPFQSLLGLFALQALVFGGVMGVVTALIVDRDRLEQSLTIASISAAVFGTLMTIVTRLQAWRWGIPKWSEFTPWQQEDENDDW